MKKYIVSLFALFLFLSVTVYAGVSSWSYSNYNNGSYVPKTGSFSEWISSTSGDGYYWSKTLFKFDSSNVSNILDYNNGGNNPGTACDNAKAYITLDMSAIPDGWDLEINAGAVYSNFPLPKYDVEDDNYFGENDESEVVALGSVVSGNSYYMKTKWDDYRDGGTNDGGDIQAQFAISKKGVWDYNNCLQSFPAVQIINPYGKIYASL